MVIQRWQSVMLLIATVLMGCFTFFSLGQLEAGGNTFNITTLGLASSGGGVEAGVSTWYFFCVSLAGTVIPLISIFGFRNLDRQKRLCIAGMLFIAAAAVVAGVAGYCLVEGATVVWSALVAAPFLSLAAVITAYRMIGSDQKKLRSVDRFHN